MDMRYFKREADSILQQLWAIQQTEECNDSQCWNVNYYTPEREFPKSWKELQEIRSTEFFKLAQEYEVLTRKEAIEPRTPSSAEENS